MTRGYKSNNWNSTTALPLQCAWLVSQAEPRRALVSCPVPLGTSKTDLEGMRRAAPSGLVFYAAIKALRHRTAPTWLLLMARPPCRLHPALCQPRHEVRVTRNRDKPQSSDRAPGIFSFEALRAAFTPKIAFICHSNSRNLLLSAKAKL
jgi:hypothetical protein